MKSVNVTVPGKVVLLGEYAVLTGAPALVQAVKRHCRVWLHFCSADKARIEAPQLHMDPAYFAVDRLGQLRWRTPLRPDFARTAAAIESSLARVRSVFRQLPPGEARSIEPFCMHIDTAELFHDGRKLGLGSSGATTVAIDAAIQGGFFGLDADWGVEEEQLLVGLARVAQKDGGSGIDVAASLSGGTLRYQLVDGQPNSRRVELPEDLHLIHVWTGKPASTSALVGAWHQAGRDKPQAQAALLAEMQQAAGQGLEAVKQGSATGLMDAMAAYGDIMSRMNTLLGQEVFTDEHRRAASLVQTIGGVYKPCGAGGGDLGVAAFSSAAQAEEFTEAGSQAGLRLLELAPAPVGLCMDFNF